VAAEGLGALVVLPPNAERQFVERDLRLVRGIADVTSLALANAGSYEELERAYLSTIEALANALEAKDEYTSDHARALAEMSLAVGTEMGIEGDRLKRLELGALFHDIGKIGVPSEIIRKPAALTAAERKLMNLHPEVGEEILAPVPFLQPIRPIVQSVPRAVGRRRLPRQAAAGRDPHGGPHHLRVRRLPRDDQ
jgi:HD-GYP domain-containing protein (c-di-GMP phosphodiesterase class II)